MGYLADLAASLASQIDLAPTCGEKDLLIKQLAEVRQAIGGSGGAATSPVDIAAGINQATDIDDIKNALTKANIRPIVNGAIAGASTSQLALSARAGRVYLEIPATTVDIWINIDAPAGLNIGIRIPKDSQSWFSPPQAIVSGAVNIWCATAGINYCIIEA